jgi:excisionase family DNA binding protein
LGEEVKMNALETPTSPGPVMNYLSRERLAEMLDVSTKTIDRRVDEGKLPAPDLHVGPQPRWKRAAIEAWLETHKRI